MSCGQSRDGKDEDIHCLKNGEKAEDAFPRVSEFWDKDLEYFERTSDAVESQIIVAEDHHFGDNELFLIDDDE